MILSRRVIFPVLILVLITVYVLIGLIQVRPPQLAPDGGTSTGFLPGRALKHIEAIAQQPHPVGSSEHDRVRDYIMLQLEAEGVHPEIQKTMATGFGWQTNIIGATIENIVGVLKGSDSSKAVMLVSHYDSAVSSPGASDDGSGVAAMLECLTVLKSSPPLKNDVIFLFTDGEELGLLGAKAFVDENPLVGNVGVVFNFEARGNRGPSVMFETSSENGRLIRELADATPNVVANSLSYLIYSLLQNDTDMSVFKRHGLSGMNFAYSEGLNHYHSRKDDIGSIDVRSLQHHGIYAIALARHFGSLDLSNMKEPDEIYFNLIGTSFIHYTKFWQMILIILTVVAGLGVAIIGFKRKRLTSSGVLIGVGALFFNVIVTIISIRIFWALIRAAHGWENIFGFAVTDKTGYYILIFVFLTIALNAMVYIRLLRRFGADSLMMGASMWWFLLMVLSFLLRPGISYLFTFPLLFSLLGMLYIFYSEDHEPASIKRFIALAATSLPGIILVSPIVYFISYAVGLDSAWMGMAVMSLMVGLFVQHIDLIGQLSKFIVPVGAAVACLCLLIVASLGPQFYSGNPKPDHVLYGLDADKQKAVWASSDQQLDDWTSQFVSGNRPRVRLEEFIPSRFQTFLTGEAPVANITPPEIEVLEDNTADGIRRLRMRIISTREAPVILLGATSSIEVSAVSIAGRSISLSSTPLSLGIDNPWLLCYYGLPKEGLDISLDIKSSEPIKLRVVDQSYGLAQLEGQSYKPRPDYLMPSAILDSDSVYVWKSFTF